MKVVKGVDIEAEEDTMGDFWRVVGQAAIVIFEER